MGGHGRLGQVLQRAARPDIGVDVEQRRPLVAPGQRDGRGRRAQHQPDPRADRDVQPQLVTGKRPGRGVHQIHGDGRQPVPGPCPAARTPQDQRHLRPQLADPHPGSLNPAVPDPPVVRPATSFVVVGPVAVDPAVDPVAASLAGVALTASCDWFDPDDRVRTDRRSADACRWPSWPDIDHPGVRFLSLPSVALSLMALSLMTSSLMLSPTSADGTDRARGTSGFSRQDVVRRGACRVARGLVGCGPGGFRTVGLGRRSGPPGDPKAAAGRAVREPRAPPQAPRAPSWPPRPLLVAPSAR